MALAHLELAILRRNLSLAEPQPKEPPPSTRRHEERAPPMAESLQERISRERQHVSSKQREAERVEALPESELERELRIIMHQIAQPGEPSGRRGGQRGGCRARGGSGRGGTPHCRPHARSEN